MADHGTFHWNELNTRDVKRAKRFYENDDRLDVRGNADAERDLLGRQGRATSMVGGIFDMNTIELPKGARALAVVSSRSTTSTNA